MASAILNNFTATSPATLPPSPPLSEAHQRSYNLSTLGAILCLLGLVAIPTLIYYLFFAVTCPPNRFQRRRSPEPNIRSASHIGKMEMISEIKCMKETENGNELQGGGECPVCLSAFLEGEEARQLKVCGHSFHVACIDMWLYSHSNCPVCRASIPLSLPNKQPAPVVVVVHRFDDDLSQGLPNSANLI